MQLDKEWYLHQQIMPPISRIINVLMGISLQEIAEPLGIDVSKYKAFSGNNNTNYEEKPEILSFGEKNTPHVKIETICQECKKSPGVPILHQKE